MTTIGSMCTGYGGLELAVHHLYPNSHVAWTADTDPDISETVLPARMPDSPNLGDITSADFNPPPVDILTAGFPCQPISQAGRQKGTEDDRWLWPDIITTVGRMDPPPGLLLLENVPRLLSINDGNAMGEIVLGLAQLGYVGSYRLLRAADVGACHQRRRWFLAAAHPERLRNRPIRPDDRGDDRSGNRSGQTPLPARPAIPQPTDPPPSGGDARLLPTPNAWDGARGPDYARARDRRDTHGSGGDDLTTTVAKLLPTPAASNAKDWTDSRATPETIGKARGDGGAGTLVDLGRLLPTPIAQDARAARNRDAAGQLYASNNGGTTLSQVATDELWGAYGTAVRRQIAATGQPPPPPVDEAQQLSPEFVEWMMMVPPGWVTALEMKRTAQLRILGNGIVPAQAAAAFAELIDTLPLHPE